MSDTNPIRGIHVYLSGPMSGLPDLNRAEFAAARALCERLGAASVFNPATAWGHSDRPSSWYMRHDLHHLTESDGDTPRFGAIVMLDGWHASRCASLEYEVARMCGIRLVGIRELRELDGEVGE